MGGGDLSALSGLYPLTMGLAMLAVLALGWGGVTVLRRGDRQRGVLMLVCALVILANVLIWTV
ncbi:hypothetical protein CA233_23175 [Sphingomonas sp. ABOLD]|uniref:Uncharacterized protein n=1 Tax=Sphingomonas trueperi TaxID=53317 RepID=A0A7X6BDM1_9SPHN|nr:MULTISPECIES: hypothetical protein [Sphingomonas]NJB97877.1 hypothetical protein [Sphingomonas trueperi]RSV35349.1 hypothetical protein CA233_23175 [Sphingomonas sp. ABOLD]RSV41475.1 hypothetical protein CA234_09345 [Sphingomonas sp. ABOLE]